MMMPSCLLLASACVATAYGMRVVSAYVAFVSLCTLAAVASVGDGHVSKITEDETVEV